jgi:cysteine synthase
MSVTSTADSVLRAIGGTPVVRLRRVVTAAYADVLIKLESVNPTGSYKDRMALAMIEGAEARGLLRPGMVGTSSGLNIAAAVQLAHELGPGQTVATVAVDTGLKYLAGDLFAK